MWELDRSIESLPRYASSFLGVPLPLHAVVATGTVTASAATPRTAQFGGVMAPPRRRSIFRTRFEISI
jgi:hypothetical protein